MIHFRRGAGGLIEVWLAVALNQRPPARRAPVGFYVGGKHGVAVAANAFHI
jgi:hypothetical protein